MAGREVADVPEWLGEAVRGQLGQICLRRHGLGQMSDVADASGERLAQPEPSLDI
jgi:hypothetical protein